MIVIVKNGMRLCQDNRFRNFANFGTFKECVKEYRSAGHAKRKAKRVKGEAVEVPKGMSMDASGHIFEENEDGYRPKVHTLLEFKL